ncbi:hypothetical protein ABMC88_13895 [Sulfitobacter sp. HNIBRBA2951]|uniref:hypothetical protein n=1 Tax=Sulfitobacter aquimarinus TaxID=3158557 RepID=UPI0032DEFD07
MKPNFALSLSFEGIKLLHRAAGGWREVGDVAITSDDLAGELAMLRKTAASLEPGGVRSKLVIPSSQIKYLTIHTPGLSDTARRKEAQTALHDATPYEVADLAFDISTEGPKTHIAAVARETLAEAEAFATEHRFHPVSFVAVPDDAPYLGEPFFGATESAAEFLEPGDVVEPDGIAVVVVGAVLADQIAEPDTVAAPAEVAPTPQEPAPDDPQGEATDSPETPAAPAPKPAVSPAPEQGDAPQTAAQPDAAPAPGAADATVASQSAEADISPDTSTDSPSDTPSEAEQDTPPAEAAPAGETVMPAPQPELDLEPAAPVKGTAETAPPTPAQPDPAPEAEPPAPVKPSPAADPSGIPPAARAAALAAAAATPDSARPSADPSAATPQAKAVSFAPSQPTPAPTPPSEPKVAATGFTSKRTPAKAPPSKPLGGAQRIAVATPLPDSSSLTQEPPVADEPATAKKTGFFSRRKPRKGAAAPVPAAAPAVAVPAAGTEAERMTVFGARSTQVGGKPRFLGLIMTVVLLVFLAGVAAWAAVFLDDGIAGLMKNDTTRATASAPENQIDPEIIRTPDGIPDNSSVAAPTVELAALDPVLSAQDTAVVDALQDPRPEPQQPVITEAEAAARYAVTGIWPLAPQTPLGLPDNLPPPVYRNTIDGTTGATDAIALPDARSFQTDVALGTIVSPPPFGQQTELNAAGMIIPTADGVVTPQGYTLVAASPPIKPPASLTRTAAQPEIAAVVSALAALRPQNRPLGLAERSERANLGGVSRVELAAFRPSLRPRSLQERARKQQEDKDKEAAKAQEADEARATAAAQAATAAAAAALAVPAAPTEAPVANAPAPALQSATRFATPKSVRPDTRPRNFARIVTRAKRAAPKETRVAAATAVAPRTVSPKLPSKASVARTATVKNAINLRKVNLIGVYGKPSSRRALVRLANGRYKKVRVGDRIDGGRVSAISSSELRYQKGGRSVRLKMP